MANGPQHTTQIAVCSLRQCALGRWKSMGVGHGHGKWVDSIRPGVWGSEDGITIAIAISRQGRMDHKR